MRAASAMSAYGALCDALAGTGDEAAFFAAIDAARRALLGEGLLTVSTYDAERSRLDRVWSSNPQAYPVGGGKHKSDTPWTRQVLQRGEVFVGEGDEAIVQAFDDHERIRGLGLRSVVNVPLLWRCECIGTFNVLRPEPRWAAEEIAHVRTLAQIALAAVLARRVVGRA